MKNQPAGPTCALKIPLHRYESFFEFLHTRLHANVCARMDAAGVGGAWIVDLYVFHIGILKLHAGTFDVCTFLYRDLENPELNLAGILTLCGFL